VPAEKRRRGDQKAGPSGTPDRPTGRGQQNPIDDSELRRAGLAPEHTELVVKDEDLEILGTIVVTRANNEASECPNDQAEEEQHRRILESGQSRLRVFDPHELGTFVAGISKVGDGVSALAHSPQRLPAVEMGA
jgi:hypothetical protein